MADEIDTQKGWTLHAYVAHNEAMREMKERLDAERDRRYTEIAIEKEKALSIKESADLAALGLAREIQTYKDEKANELREQINSERGLYASKGDLFAAIEKIAETVKPLAAYVNGQQGRTTNSQENRAYLFAVVGAIVGFVIAGVTVAGFLAT